MTPLTETAPMNPVTGGDDFASAVPITKLRRAEYVHVADLVPIVDEEKLRNELLKIKDGGNLSQPSSESEPPLEIEGSGRGHIKNKISPPSGGFNLCLLVGKVNIVVDKVRVDKSRVRLAEVEVGDGTGTVSLRARDEQIDLLEDVCKEENGAVVLRNCTLELYQGKHLRLAITKWGKLNKYPDNVESTPSPPTTMNTDVNYSIVDFNLVLEENKMLKSNVQERHDAEYTSSPTGSNHPLLQRKKNVYKGGNRGQASPRHQHQNQNYSGAPTIHKPMQMPNYGGVPLDAGNPNNYQGVNTYSPIYGASQVFGYEQGQLVDNQRHPGHSLAGQQQMHQKNHVFYSYQIQQQQLHMQYQQQQQQQQQLFHQNDRTRPPRMQQNTNENIDTGGDFSNAAVNANNMRRDQFTAQSHTPRPSNERGTFLQPRQTGDPNAIQSNREQGDFPVLDPEEQSFVTNTDTQQQQDQQAQAQPSYELEPWSPRTGFDFPMSPQIFPQAATFAPSYAAVRA